MISVVIPTYNRKNKLERALQSVVNQSHSASQIIVVDDGSNDETGDMLNSRFPMIDYYYQENLGVSAARNLGVRKSTYPWIALLDSDDEWVLDKLQKQINLLKETQLKVCHTEEVWIRNGVRVNQMKKHTKQGGWIYQSCLPLCAMSPSSIILHREVFDSVGLFDTSLPACEDYDMWLRVTDKYEVAFESSPLTIKYGGHEDQLSRQFWGMDRFRVIALEKMLNQGCSKTIDQEATKLMLIEKLKILETGANKHNNREMINYCEQRLSRYDV